MSEKSPDTKRINVEGVPEDLFRDFKICVVINRTTIKEVIIAFLEKYVNGSRKDFNKEIVKKWKAKT